VDSVDEKGTATPEPTSHQKIRCGSAQLCGMHCKGPGQHFPNIPPSGTPLKSQCAVQHLSCLGLPRRGMLQRSTHTSMDTPATSDPLLASPYILHFALSEQSNPPPSHHHHHQRTKEMSKLMYSRAVPGG
jgi:hypothetical protein